MKRIPAFCATLFAVLASLNPPALAGPLYPYQGNGADGAKALPRYEALVGGKAYGVTDFIAFDSWTSFDNDAGWGIGGWKGRGYKLAESVPLTVKGTSLEDVAAGKQDAHFAQLARTLVAAGFPDAYVRLGWEFNGGWYPWAFKGHEAAYAAAFRHVAGVMRGAAGQRFRFVWCPAQGMQQQWPDWTYPGDDVIDVIGLDVYNQSWSVDVHDKGALWNDVLNSAWGVKQIVAFAAKHGKPYAFPEFGTGDRPDGHGGGDDATFYPHMAPYVAAAEFAGPWDFDAGDYNSRLSTGERPQAAAAFQAAFAATKAAAARGATSRSSRRASSGMAAR